MKKQLKESMEAIHKFKRLLLLCLTWAAFTLSVALPLRAQFICHIAEDENMGPLPLYSDYLYTALSCRGNKAVVAASFDSIVGGSGLVFFISTDGGTSWASETDGFPALTRSHNPVIREIDQIDALHIIAAGDSGLLVRTMDGGATWETLPAPTTRPIEDISFSDSLNGVMVVADTTNGTYVTANGGVDWSPAPFTRPYGWKCHAYGGGMYRVFVIGSGTLYTTRDNWKTIDSSSVTANLSSASRYGFSGCSFGAGDTLFAYGYHRGQHSFDPYISRTTNGGKEWTTMYDDSSSMWNSGNVNVLSDIGRDTIIAGGGNIYQKVIWSTNRGETWRFDTLISADSDFQALGNNGVGFSSAGELILSYNGLSSSLVEGIPAALAVAHYAASPADLLLFPNPATTTLELKGSFSRGSVLLLDVLGRVALRANISGSGALTLDVARLPRWVYAVMIDQHGVMVPAGRVALVAK